LDLNGVLGSQKLSVKKMHITIQNKQEEQKNNLGKTEICFQNENLTVNFVSWL